MAWYDTGTVSVTNGSTTVTGSGTNFIAGAQIGEAFYGPDDNLYEIQSIVSATSLTLADPYLGSTQSGQTYKIIPTQSLVATLASQVSSLISDFQTVADEAGEGKFDDGSAASPGITFNLDQDTGLSRPAANQIGVSTAGVQRLLLTSTALTSTVGFSGTTGTFSGNLTVDTNTLFVNSSTNNVGIGTNSPAEKLDVSNGVARFANNITPTDENDDAAYFGKVDGQAFVSNNGGFAVRDNGTNRLVVDTSGNVGIGTSSPSAPLDVVASGAGTLAEFRDGVAANFIIETSGAVATIGNQAGTSQLAFKTSNAERMRIDSSGNVGIGTSSPSEKLSVTGNVTISGSLSKGSGSFKIDHPIKPDTHHLVHSFIEGPQADNLYRGKVALVDGTATVNLDESGRMTEGTFVALNGNVQCFTTNEDGWTAVRGKVNGNILTIEAEDADCTDTVSWLVIGERHDEHMLGANWTDDQGRIITEPTKGA